MQVRVSPSHSDYGVAFQDRWKVTRERMLAMQEIWTKDVAEFHGQFVNFDPLWCWPKPMQAGGPPVLMGAWSKWVVKRIVDYCDGWIPVDARVDLASGIEALRSEAARVGRRMDEFDLSVITGYELVGDKRIESRIRELIQLGFHRILFFINPGDPNAQRPILERYAGLIRQFN